MAERLEPVRDDFQNWNAVCRMVGVGDQAAHRQDTRALEGEGVRVGWTGRQTAVENIEQN